MIRRVLCSAVLMSAAAVAQQPLATVGIQDATVSGALEVTNGTARLMGNTTITAKDHTAQIALTRGGSVRVCATSGLHLTAGLQSSGVQPLMLALDRGAIEIQMAANATDVVLTPDLRFAMQGSGPLDLRLRVTRYGDTCVENRGSKAPLLHITDQFGESTYDVRPGQHVMFEHASLKEVVDSETSPCGCPPAPVVSVADSGTTSATPAAVGSAVSSKDAVQEHPFPAAVSQGLSPTPAVPSAPPATVHAQVAATLSYSPDAVAAPSTATDGGVGATSATSGGAISASTSAVGTTTTPASARPDEHAQAPLPPAPPSAPDLAHRIGHFFKRLFGKGKG